MYKISDLIKGKGRFVYIVAEIGINHNGDLELAKRMIQSASKCGANAVKFQTLVPEELFTKSTNPKLYEMSKKWVLDKKQHLELKKYAERHGLDFFSTPFGDKSIKLLRDLKIKMIKIPSSDMNNFDLIGKAMQNKVPLVISTGMSTLSEIASTVEFIKSGKRDFILLHCNSGYPTPIEDANLSSIPFLHETFRVPVGYSDHTLGTDACLAAVALGACMLEKHFTVDKNLEGPDQKLSADPKEFEELVKKVRKTERLLGSIRNEVTKSEKKARVLMRKSVGVKFDIKKGTKIKKSMLTLIRPGTGISPNMIAKLVGITLKKDVKNGTLLSWSQF